MLLVAGFENGLCVLQKLELAPFFNRTMAKGRNPTETQLVLQVAEEASAQTRPTLKIAPEIITETSTKNKSKTMKTINSGLIKLGTPGELLSSTEVSITAARLWKDENDQVYCACGGMGGIVTILCSSVNL